MKKSVLMAYPEYFAIRGGANPHTRNADNSMKSVDLSAALQQWDRYTDQLRDCGIDVYIAEGNPELTGIVFAANAGFFDDRLSPERTFYPSRFTANHRRGESEVFAKLISGLGFPVEIVPDSLLFEGEADAYPLDRDHKKYIFTYGFRSDPKIQKWVEGFHSEVLGFELQDPRFYHGDCLICSLGEGALVWEKGLADGSRKKLERETEVIWITDQDAADFIGNSFYIETESDRFLFSPHAIRDHLKGEIEERGIYVIPVDISEFFTKGGGGPKCMVFNLDSLPVSNDRDVELFRERHLIQNWKRLKPQS